MARHRHLFSCSCGGIRSSGRVQMSLCEDSFLFQDGDSEIFLVQFHQGVLPGIIFNAQIKRDYVMRAHHPSVEGKSWLGLALCCASALLVSGTSDQNCQLRESIWLYAVELFLWPFPVC